MICQSHVTITYMYNFLFIISLVLYIKEFTFYPFLPLTYSIAQHCSVSTWVTYHIYWHDLFAQMSVQSLCLHPAILDKKSYDFVNFRRSYKECFVESHLYQCLMMSDDFISLYVYYMSMFIYIISFMNSRNYNYVISLGLHGNGKIYKCCKSEYLFRPFSVIMWTEANPDTIISTYVQYITFLWYAWIYPMTFCKNKIWSYISSKLKMEKLPR